MTKTNRIPFVDAQILAHVADIVALDLRTERGHSEAMRRTKSLFASFTNPGLVQLLNRSEDGRRVLSLKEDCDQSEQTTL